MNALSLQRFCAISPRRYSNFIALRRFSSIYSTRPPISSSSFQKQLSGCQHNFKSVSQTRWISVSSRSKEASIEDEKELLELLGVTSKPRVDPNVSASDTDVAIDIATISPPTPLGTWSEYCLEQLHSSGLSYSALIIVSSAAIRLLAMPLDIRRERWNTNISNNFFTTLDLHTKVRNAEISKNKAEIDSMTQIVEKYMDEKQLPTRKDQKIDTLIQLLLLAPQLWIWHRVAASQALGMSTEGLLWFRDLTLVDPTFLLPIVATWGTVAYFLLKNRTVLNTDDKLIVYTAMGFLSVPYCILLSKLSTGVLLCGLTNLSISLLFMGLLQLPAVRKLFNIQKLIKVPIDEMRDAFKKTTKSKSSQKSVNTTK